ncbi:MAG: DUF4037 domain-containing protein [Thermomicrobiales bacterium]|nr:DUF4037 domain-containing protein [Thermomicrobiales bacterium]
MSMRDAVTPEAVMPHLVQRIAEMPGVVAVALGGSASAGQADGESDVDLYVYSPEPPPVALRRDLALAYDPAPEIDNRAFGPGDEWGDPATGLAVDLIYWSPAWIEEQLDRVLDRHEPSIGYSTCFWRTVQRSIPLVDPTGWFARLQANAAQPYPEALRRAIVANNLPLLRDARSSFLHQIEKAIARDDAVSVQHRVTALLASWFDVLFAFNRVPHPGEKRLLAIARAECGLIPAEFERQIAALLAATPPPWHDGHLTVAANELIDGIDALLRGDPTA